MENENKIYEKLLGISTLEVNRVELSTNRVDIYCQSKLNNGICPNCLKQCSEVNQSYTRVIRDLDLLGRKVYLHLEVRQFHCEDCDRYFSERFEFVRKNSIVTKRQEKWIFEICKKQTIKEVGSLLDMGVHQVEKIFYIYGQKHIDSNDRYAQVRRLGLDEIALRKGHKSYACVLVDIERGWIIDILPSRDKSMLMKHLLSKGEKFLNQIEVVTCDMWDAYVNVSKTLFPNAQIVIDRFHWMKHLTKAVDSQRKLERKLNPELEELKGVKWKLIKNKNKLSESELEELEKVFESAPELEVVYEFKNSFQSIFDCNFSKEKARSQIEYWKNFAKQLGNKYLDKFIKTYNNWEELILNYFDGGYSNGIVEGLNNSIKTIKRQTYGLLNFEHFKTRILLYYEL